jgi:hypothetical protein
MQKISGPRVDRDGCRKSRARGSAGTDAENLGPEGRQGRMQKISGPRVGRDGCRKSRARGSAGTDAENLVPTRIRSPQHPARSELLNRLSYISLQLTSRRGTRWRRWLRHYARSREIARSIPDDLIGVFHWHNPSGPIMARGSIQPVTEMSSSNISWG